MTANQIEIRVRGKTTSVPSIDVDGREIIVTGKWLKIAGLRDEQLVEGEPVSNPETFASRLKESCLRADIFVFVQRLGDATPNYNYYLRWDNAAVATTASFTKWWEKIPQESRKNTRRAAKRGVSVHVTKFNDELVEGIKRIYDEQPVRQGRPFWHFGKDFETVKMENATYPERSEFIGAYHNGELIGFLKLIYVDRTARIIQILSMTSHYDKRPMNALITKAVEVCHEKGISHLVYGNFSYGNKKNSPLAEFKRRNGFEQVRFPRYYMPLTLKGSLALRLRLHLGLSEILPSQLINLLVRLRSMAFRIVPDALFKAGADNSPWEERRNNEGKAANC